MVLPRRLPYELAIIAVLMLTSCSGPKLSDAQRDEVDDIASAAVGESDEFTALRSRVDALEQKLKMQ